jgi:hypothetical protein
MTGVIAQRTKAKWRHLQEKKFGKFSPEEVLKYVLPEGKYTSSNKKMQKKVKI